MQNNLRMSEFFTIFACLSSKTFAYEIGFVSRFNAHHLLHMYDVFYYEKCNSDRTLLTDSFRKSRTAGAIRLVHNSLLCS